MCLSNIGKSLDCISNCFSWLKTKTKTEARLITLPSRVLDFQAIYLHSLAWVWLNITNLILPPQQCDD